MSMIKFAFDLGVALARNEAGFIKQAAPDLGQFVDKLKAVNWPWKKDEPNAFKTWKPYAIGAGLGLGTYGLLRHPFLADPKKYPVLRRIQEASGGNMVRVGRRTTKPSTLEKLIDPIIYGPEAIAKETASGQVHLPKNVAGTASKPTAVFSGYDAGPFPKTFDPSLGAVSPEEATKTYKAQQAFEDKLLQADLLEKHAPGSMAKTHKIDDILTKHNIQIRPENLQEDLAKLQEVLRTEFKDRPYIIKTRAERKGGDPMTSTTLQSFPTQDTDLFQEHQKWQKMRKEFLSRVENDPAETVKAFRDKPGFQGRLVDEILNQNAIVQERLPIKQYTGRTAESMKSRGFSPVEEYRVHAIGGHVNPRLVVPRRYSDLKNFVPEYTSKSRRVADYAQGVLDKLPPEYRNMTFGMDVAPLEGKPNDWRIIELNPGGMSGILDQPTMGHALHREITGRSTIPEAVGGGLAAGGIGVGLSGGVLNSLPSNK